MSRRGVRLPVVTEHEARGDTAQVYDIIRARFGIGFVPEVFQLLGSRPQYLQVLWDAYQSVFDTGVLAREVKELIAAFVATEAGCQYCAGAHSLLAQMTGASPQIVAATRASSVADMPVDGRLRALMQFVSQIDQAAYRITDDDLHRLRDCGWSDAELLEAVWTACILNAVVRLVDTFGLSVVGQFSSRTQGEKA
jgi:uncharacterized peroxidase-related enzyme